MAGFEAYNLSLELITALRPILVSVGNQDRDLAEQIRRAASSVPLNLSEGARRIGRDRSHCFRIAAGSAAEVRAAIAVAIGWGYLAEIQVGAANQLVDRLIAMLWRLTHPKK
ncbi:four helix bundle protein [bacterium]|jgi:four helix bundle protein|nr:four helix bundle protein [bacterium]